MEKSNIFYQKARIVIGIKKSNKLNTTHHTANFLLGSIFIFTAIDSLHQTVKVLLRG